jgi:site-specific DNA-methyltransferase (adenine-specific)
MNPPFGYEIPRFVHKAWLEANDDAEIVVCLLPARVDTRWWHEYVMTASEIRFIKGRLTFGKDGVDAVSPAPFPCAIVVFDPQRTGDTVYTSVGRFLAEAPMLMDGAA